MIASAAEFCRLRQSADPDECRQAAHDEAPTRVWFEVIRDHPGMRFWVAQNKTVPVEVLERLAADPDVRVRQMVARKRKITEKLALTLARDRDETVRAALLHNRKLPATALALLRDDSSPLVQETLRERQKRDGAQP